MSDPVDNAWRSITDEGADPVPVTVAQASKPSSPEQKITGVTSYVRVNPSMHGSMSLAAISGILLVLLSGATFYLGTDFLRASLTGSTEAVSVVITENGAFAPSQVDVHGGDVLTIENRNANAQLLRGTETSTQFFTEQVVLAGETFTYNIPLNAPEGTYIVQSAVLPGQTLTISLHPKEKASASSVSVDATANPENSDEFMQNILIPSLNDLGGTQTSATSSASSQSVPLQTNPQSVRQDQTFMLTQGNQNIFAPFTNSIETNPYTVGSMAKRPLPGSSSKGSLHSGAPLITKHTPRSSSQTGPGLWLLGILILVSLGGVTYKMKRVAS